MTEIITIALIALGAVALLALTAISLMRRNNESPAEQRENEQARIHASAIESARDPAIRANDGINVNSPAPLNIRPLVAPKAPPPPPLAMRSLGGSGFRSSSSSPSVHREDYMATQNNGISVTDVIVTALVVDALTDTAPAAVETCDKPARVESSTTDYDSTSSSNSGWGGDSSSGWSSSDSSDSGWSSSDSSSSSWGD